MATTPKNIRHPSFGPCVLNPSLIAIRWRQPQDAKGVNAALATLHLQPAEPKSSPTRRKASDTSRTNAAHEPEAEKINHSTTLTWASGVRPTDALAKRITEDSNIEWTAPVYRATASTDGDRSLFAINPTVLVLTEAAAATLTADDDLGSGVIDSTRTAVMKGFVVYKFPGNDAIQVGQRLAGKLGGLPNAISFENIPYLSPICCGCDGGAKKSKGGTACGATTTPHFPNDAFFGSQWGLQRINAPSAWAVSRGDPNIVVAVLDQGVELLHPDLNLWPVSYSTVTHTNDGSPVGDHGTACAGIISARMDNNLGPTGLAPDCRVMAIATNFADTEVAEGLFYAADHGARVVSMSFGVYPSWMTWNFAIIEAALQYCHEKNVCLVAATGNENQAVSRFPATDPRTFGIGGANRADVRKAVGDTSIEGFWGACYGPDVDVVAPCLEIPTTDRLGAAGYTPTDYDLRFNGTSSATPHVAALAGLILSVCPKMSNAEVYETIAVTCDKINLPAYAYSNTSGKPFGTWNAQVGYGRINAERALLVACQKCKTGCGCGGAASGECSVCLHEPEPCCVSPCEPAWRTEDNCLVWYEEKIFRVPINRDNGVAAVAVLKEQPMIEFQLTYEHRLCLLGKQHGPLLYTTTLLPGETLNLYHSDRYRRITSTQQRYSVQTTFMQFLQVVHQARVTNTMNTLNEQLSSSRSSSASDSGGGFFFGLFGFGSSGTDSSSKATSSLSEIDVHFASDQFYQSVSQSSLLTHAERSVVISTYEDRDTVDISVRRLHNANECRAVTYFVRQILELYALSTRLADIKYRIIYPNLPDVWHSINDVQWLPPAIQVQIKNVLNTLPKIGTVITGPRPISIPTDGVVYDPELANCCSCEPEKAAAIGIRLETEKASAMKACLDVQQLELELTRRRMLLAKGDLSPFEPAAALPTATPIPVPTPP